MLMIEMVNIKSEKKKKVQYSRNQSFHTHAAEVQIHRTILSKKSIVSVIKHAYISNVTLKMPCPLYSPSTLFLV